MPRSKLSTGICRGPTATAFSALRANYRVVVPYPDRRELDQARILCVGEQLYDFIDQRLEPAPEQLLGTATWCGTGCRWTLGCATSTWRKPPVSTGDELAGPLLPHLRRLTLIPVVEPFDDQDVFPYSQYGLVCPYCTPEGPNIGRVARSGPQCPHPRRQARTDRLKRPTASWVFRPPWCPFLEHDDTNRALMGINMMRQWTSAADAAAPIHSTGWFRQQYDQRLASKGNKPRPAP